MAAVYVRDLPYDFEETLRVADAYGPLLSDSEDEFIDYICSQYGVYGLRMVVTDRQAEMLDRIRTKIF
jgi:hypothetical protein